MTCENLPKLVSEYLSLYRHDWLRAGILATLRILGTGALAALVAEAIILLVYIGSVLGWGEIGSLIGLICWLGVPVLGIAVFAVFFVLCVDDGLGDELGPVLRAATICASVAIMVVPWFFRSQFEVWKTILNSLPFVPKLLWAQGWKVSPAVMTNLHVLIASLWGQVMLIAFVTAKPGERVREALKIWRIRLEVQRLVMPYQAEMVANNTAPVCMPCLTRADARQLAGSQLTYHACRICGRVYGGGPTWAFYRRNVALLDAAWKEPTMPDTQDPTVLCVSAIQAAQPFGFDVAVVRSASDVDLERFVMLVSNDQDDVRRQHCATTTCFLQGGQPLAPHTLSILKHCFKDVRRTPQGEHSLHASKR